MTARPTATKSEEKTSGKLESPLLAFVSPFAQQAHRPFPTEDEDEDMQPPLTEYDSSSEDDGQGDEGAGFWGEVGTDLRLTRDLTTLISRSGFTDFRLWWADNLVSDSEDEDEPVQEQAKTTGPPQQDSSGPAKGPRPDVLLPWDM